MSSYGLSYANTVHTNQYSLNFQLKTPINIKLTEQEMSFYKYLLIDDYISAINGAKSIIPKAYTSVNPEIIHKEYKKNEAAGDLKYKDKEVVLKGKIKTISRSIGDNYYIEFYSGKNVFTNTKAIMKSGNQEYLATLNKGNSVTLHCIGNGLTLGSPIFAECQPIERIAMSETNENIKKLPKMEEITQKKYLLSSIFLKIALSQYKKDINCNHYSDEINTVKECINEIKKIFKNWIKIKKSYSKEKFYSILKEYNIEKDEYKKIKESMK